MGNHDLRSSIHKKLIWRLGLVSLFVCATLAVGVNVRERGRVSDAVIERARQDVSRINELVRPELEARGDVDTLALERALVIYGDGAVPLSAGRFALVNIYDTEGRRISRDVAPDFESVGELEHYMSGVDHRRGDSRAWWHKFIQVKGTPCIHVAAPLENSGGDVVAHIEGVFVVSDEEIAAIRRRMLRTALAGVGVVLLTTLLIYPIIASLIGRLSRLAVRLLDANLETLQVLGSAIAKRDSGTDVHNFRVTVYSVRLAEAVGLSVGEIRSLIKGAFLHDVGKIGVRDNVLLKPGPLSEGEYEVMKRHVHHGLDIVDRSDWLNDARAVVGGHHEKFDGTGYHRGLRGKDIPISARIFALADVFDALTSRRPYKEPFGYDDSMQVLETGRGTHFDPHLLAAFKNIARSLYDDFVDQGIEKPKIELERIVRKYFKNEVGDLI